MLLQAIISLILTGAAVVVAGTVLARGGDTIAARTGLGGLWIGTIFLATATSLPELTTDIAAVRMGLPDLAAGDLFGSSMANMLILALVSLIPGTELFRKAALENALLISLAMILTAIAAITIVIGPTAGFMRVGPGSALLAIVYLVGARLIFQRSSTAREAGLVEEMSAVAETEEGETDARGSLRRAVISSAAAALVILIAAPFFASSASDLADATGISVSFVGTWLLGFSTSLPELATSLAAVRMRAYDLAVGNLFGSNCFNMTMFVLLDVAHGQQPVLSAVDPVHILSALIALVLMGIGLAAVVSRAQRRASLAEPSGAMMVLVYVAGLALIYLKS